MIRFTKCLFQRKNKGTVKRLLLLLFLFTMVTQLSWGQTITKSSGWLESAFVEWSPVSGADSYNVYYTGGGQTNKKIDTQLIRSYGTYFRADIPGLAAGAYTIKVAPVTATEESTGTTTSNLTVLAQDRTGFAFDGGRVPGGYKADGTPKTGAVILYITQNTKNTISMNITGATTNPCVGLQNILYAIKKGNDTRPFIIRLIGNITDMTVMEGGDITIENANNQSSYLTIEGVGDDAVVNGMGIRLKTASNIEVSNLGFMNCDSTAGDNVGMQQDNDHIWVHNCDLFYGNAGVDADQIKGDGALDNKGSTYVTLSYNHFWDNGKSSLLGLSENTTVGLYITYHHNWFDHSDSRHPRVRFYSAHVYNNYYDGNSKYGVGSTMGSSVFVEGNYYRNCKHPMMTSLQGTDIWDDTNQVNNAPTMGTFSGEAGGTIKAFNNTFVADSGTNSMRFVAYGDTNPLYNIAGKISSTTDFDAYLATTRGENVPSSVVSKSGGNTYNNFDTDAALYVKNLTIDTPAAAKDKVMQYAGRVSGGDLKWTFTAADDNAYLVITELKTELTNYTGALVAVQGESTPTGSQTLTSTTNNDQTVASGAAIGTIVFTWGGDATDATVTGLPASGISFVKNTTAKTITITGTPTATVSYSIATSGTLGTTVTGSGTITVTPASVQTLTFTANNSQTVASGAAIGTIVFTWGGVATDATVTGLPASGISFVKDATAKTITISGTPTATVSYSIATSGSSGTAATGSGTITVSTASAGDETHNFTVSGKTSSFYTITGNMNSIAGSETYDGLTLTARLKMETATSITYTTTGTSTLTLVFDAGFVGTVKLNNVSYTAVNGVVVIPSIPAGANTIAKGTTTNLFYIKTVYDGGIPEAIAQTITFNVLTPVTYGDTAFDLTATASSALPVSYTSSNAAVATVAGNTVTIVGAGSTNIMASQAGNSSYTAATDVVQSLTVNKKNLTIATPVAQSKTYDGNVAASITGTLSGVINSDDVSLVLSGTFADATPGTGKVVTSTATLTGTKATNYVLIQPTGLTADITIPAPTAAAQTFCGAATVADLVATGTSLKWYTAANGGSVLNSSTALATGTYYVSQTLAGVEGTARTSVAVTITPVTNTGSVTQSQCGGTYTWPANGVTYSASATQTVVSGCNTAILNLTITPLTTTGSVTQSQCGGTYIWPANGVTYSASTTQTVVSGCNTATLNLTITVPTTSGSITQTQCGGTYTWPANGVTYSASTTQTVVSGCNTATLNLTITPVTTTGSVTTSINTGSSYTWPANGVTYTTAQTNLTYTVGCNTATLNLTISTPSLKTDVWDFGATQLDTNLYNNMLTVTSLNSVLPGTAGTVATTNLVGNTTFTTGVLTWTGSSDRLRTTNTAITRYDTNIASVTGYTGRLYANGLVTVTSGLPTSKYLTMTLAEDDEITLISRCDAASGTLTFVLASNYLAQKDTYSTTYATGATSEVKFVAKTAGAYRIYDATNKASFFRIYRKAVTYTTITGNLDVTQAPDLPGTYSVLFTNAAGKVWTAPVNAGAYSVTLPAGYTYTMSLSNANGYIITNGDSLNVTTSTTNYDITLLKASLFAVSGAVSGLGTDISKATLVYTPNTTKVYVPKPVINTANATYAVSLEPNTQYTVSASGINDYEILSNTITITGATTAAVAFSPKTKYGVTINATGLTTTQLNILTLTFTNLNESGYVYTFAPGSAISLRNGIYAVSYIGLDAYPIELGLISNLTVNGSNVSKTLAFKPVTVWSFEDKTISTSTTSYKGMLFGGAAGTISNQIASGHLIAKSGGIIKIPVSVGDKISVSYYYTANFSIEGGTVITTATNSTSILENVEYTYDSTTAANPGYVTITLGGAANYATYLTEIKIGGTTAYAPVISVGTDKNYQTINAALDAISKMVRTSTQRVTVVIDPGNYEEMVEITQPNVTFKNAASVPSIILLNKGVDIDAAAVRITSYYGHGYNYYSMSSDQKWHSDVLSVNKQNGYLSYQNTGAGTTNNSYWNATLIVSANGFEANDIIIENSYNQYISKKESEDVVVLATGNKGLRPTTIGSTAVQDKAFVERAAAIAVKNNIDKVILNKCRVVGRQDSFYGGTGARVVVNKGVMMGATDYIFGGMNAVFYKSDLAMNTSDVSSDLSYITAAQQSTGRGYLMYECKVTTAIPGTETASVYRSKPGYFGRPWAVATSEVVFYNTTIETSNYTGFEGQSLIMPLGWLNSLSGESAKMYEYGTIENSGIDNASSRAAWATKLSAPTLTDGTAISTFNFTKGSDNWDPLSQLIADGISAPTAAAQTFCAAATVANLVATGTSLKWYAGATGGSALDSAFALVTGTTYYVSQTIDGIEGTARTSVAVTITAATTTGSVTTSICAGSTYHWDANNTDYTTAQSGLTVVSGCNTATLNLTVTPKPTAVVTNATICSGETYTWSVNSLAYTTSQTETINNEGCTANQVLNLSVTPKPTAVVTNATICSGETYTWSANSVGYTTSQTETINNDGCTANQVLNLSVTPKPTAVVTNATICSGATYTWSVNNVAYTSSQTITITNDGCTANQVLNLTVTPAPNAGTNGTLSVSDSPSDAALFAALTGADAGGSWSRPSSGYVGVYTYTVNATSACTLNATATVTVTASTGIPIGPLSFCKGATVATAVGSTSLKFYTASTGGTFLAGTTALATKTYYATETINSVESTPRTAVSITVNDLPATVATLTTSDAVLCRYIGTANEVTYTAASGASSYDWTVPTGVSIVGGKDTATLTVNFATATQAFVGSLGAIGVKAVDGNGCISKVAKTIALATKLPVAPTSLKLSSLGIGDDIKKIGPYMGTDTVFTLTAPAAASAASYRWELPTGVTQLSGDTSNVITVDFLNVTPAIGSLVIKVYSVGGCGESTARTLTLARVLPAKPSVLVLNDDAISDIIAVTKVGPYTGKETPLTLRTTAASTLGATATSYKWVLPEGVHVASGALTDNLYLDGIGTRTVTSTSTVLTVTLSGIAVGVVSIPVNLYAVNGAGTSLAKTLTLTAAAPATPVIITANTTFDKCHTTTYAATNIPGATYNWIIPAGATGTSTTNSIVVDFTNVTTASAYAVTCSATNGTGTSTVKSLTIKKAATCATPRIAPEAATEKFSAVAFPNPSTEGFNIKSSNEKSFGVQVYDMLGRSIEQRQMTSGSKIGSNYAKGIYNVIVNQGANVKTLRVIKE